MEISSGRMKWAKGFYRWIYMTLLEKLHKNPLLSGNLNLSQIRSGSHFDGVLGSRLE